MGGPSANIRGLQRSQGSSAANQSTLAQEQAALLGGESQNILSPAIGYYKELAGGNPQALLSAIAPTVAQASANEASARQSIESSIPRGGAQELALAELPIETASTVSSAANQAYQGAFPALANLGLSLNSQAMGEQGLALAGTQTAAQTYGQVGQEEAQGKAATMGFFGSLAGAAGQAAGAAHF